MRTVSFALSLLTLFLAGCGYVGPVLPPSPKLPLSIANLTVVERGDQLAVSCTAPQRTSDDVFIKEFSQIDLGVGPDIAPFDFEKWSAQAKHYSLPIPGPVDPSSPPTVIQYQIPVSEWGGKSVDVFIRTAEKDSRFSSWSNRVHLEVVPPLTAPQLTAKDVREGVLLSWTGDQPGAHYDVYRRGPSDKTDVKIGTAERNDYVDTSSAYETPYQYSVIAVKGMVESVPSAPVQIVTHDVYAPSVPASITALGAVNSIEVTWSRSPESDLKGYYVYRSTDGGPFERIGGLINVPTFSDHSVQAGKTYRYRVSAIDLLNHESDKSRETEPITAQ